MQSSNSETQVICEDEHLAPCRDTAPVQFIEHNAAKAGNTFEFDWIPPADASAGDVRFYERLMRLTAMDAMALATGCSRPTLH